MSIITKTGSVAALLACLSYGSVNSVYAAQLDFQDPYQSETPSQPVQAEIDTDLCDEDFSPAESELNSLNLGPNLVASAVASDTPLLVADGTICDLGGIAPEGAGLLAGGGAGLASILAPVGGIVAGGGAIAALAGGGGDGDDATPSVPEPAELATASLFATLGVAGVLLRRKKKSEEV